MNIKAELECLEVRTYVDKNNKERNVAIMFDGHDVLKVYVSNDKANKLKNMLRQKKEYNLICFIKDNKITNIVLDNVI